MIDGWGIAVALIASLWLINYWLFSDPRAAVVAIFSLLLGIFINGVKE